MKKSIFVAFYLLISVWLYAEVSTSASDTVIQNDPTHLVLFIDTMEHAVVYQDSLIRNLMIDRRLGRERGQQEITGFRVQVYSSNQHPTAKNEALLLEKELAPSLDLPVYTISEPPFWKVRIGNFRTRDDANKYKEFIISQYPELRGSTYVVPDKVTIINP